MALGQQQQQELSICHRDVKHKFFVFLLKAEQPFFICLSVCPWWPHREGSGTCRIPVGTEPWACTPLGAPLKQGRGTSRAGISAAGAPQHPQSLWCSLCWLGMCPGLNLGRYLVTLRCRHSTALSPLCPWSGLQSHVHTGTWLRKDKFDSELCGTALVWQ